MTTDDEASHEPAREDRPAAKARRHVSDENAPPKFRLEATLPDGSEVWIGPSFGILIRPGENAAVEIARLEERLRRKTTRVPGPYSGT